MPKCCITDCVSGTFKDNRNRKAVGLRGAAFFSFPKDKDLLEKWKNALSCNVDQEIDDKSKICELHFNEADVTRYDNTVLKDGTIYRLPRKRFILHGKAIPFANNKKRKLQYEDSPHEPGSKKSKIILKNGSSLLQVGKQKVVLPTNNVIVMKKTYVVPKEKINNHVNTNHDHKYVKELINTPEFKEVHIKSEIIDEAFSGEIHENNGHLNEKTGKDNDVNIQTTQSVLKNLVLKNESKDQDSGVENKKCVNGYSFTQLKHDLQTKNFNLSSAWAHVYREDDSFTFIYVHPLKLVIQCYCTIDRNMNMQVTTPDRRMTKDVVMEIKTKTDLFNLFFTLQRTQCCDGIGIENKYSDDCVGFITSETKYTRFKGYNRCHACRDERKLNLKKTNEKSNLELKLHQQNRKIEDLEFKYDQLQKLLKEKA